uniref:Uncharacterized protein n=1 Tax=Ananas comosus var. bracteatus TaxID=296719 RepID=A0A6V7NTU7_ANACO|nr:unnamed protein product [Ananas comosus var. bracteatus]
MTEPIRRKEEEEEEEEEGRKKKKKKKRRGAFPLLCEPPSFHQMSRESHSVTLQINQQGEDNEGENEQKIKVVRDQLKRIIAFSGVKITMAFVILLAFLNGTKDIRAMHSSTVIKAYNFLIWATLQSPILLLLTPEQGQCRMSLIVIPVIAIICFLGYRATQNVNDHDSANHESYKPEQKKAFKFATAMATMAITVQTEEPFKLCEIQQHCYFGPPRAISRCARHAVLGNLSRGRVLAGAHPYLRILHPGVSGYRPENPTSARPLYHDPRYAGVMRNGIAMLISVNGGLLAFICVESVGIAPQQYYMSLGLKVCAFFQLLAIESGLIWIGLMFEPPHGEMWASIVEIFYSVSLLLQLVMILAGAVMLFIVLS